ncbi:vitellogenin-1-like [Mytilus californianus]|uniref:vitellogenin-1-like n=1 Tax=Mytilus californianus TaxID=6549 RepID=UPI00224582C0|nr:vitellogenin-1-like [Mytilus californianus]
MYHADFKAFSPNREYVYEYEAQLATGMPGGSKLYSGLKVKSDVRFQFQTVSRVTMKMDKVYLYKLNGLVENENPTREQLSVYEELSGPEATWMMDYLIKSMTFKYIKGHVQEIKGESDDNAWSINVKKGILSLLEMNLEERMSVSSKDRLVELNRNRFSPTDFYTVMEPSVVGDCETTYNLETDIPNDGQHYMYLTKVKNYKRCLDRPVYTRSYFNAMKCAQCENERTEPFKSASQIRYVLKGDKRRFLIQSAIAESQHVFTPYSAEGGNVATYINQTLVLINQEEIQNPIAGPRNPQIYTNGLQADVDDMPDQAEKPLTMQPYLDQKPKRTPSEVKQLISKYLDMIVAYSKDEVEQQATSVTFTLADEIRRADADILRSVWEEYGEGTDKSANADKYYKREILLDILPMTGTPAAFEVLSDYIRKAKTRPERMSVAINAFTVTAYPDINIAKYLLEMVRDKYVWNTEPLRQSTYMCLGAFADRIRVEKDKLNKKLLQKEKQIKALRDVENRKYVRSQFQSKLTDVQDQLEQTSAVFSKLKMEILKEVRLLMKSQNPEDLILALKTIGNAGYPDFISDSKSILEDKSKSQIIRAQAIYSLRKITAYSPEAVRVLLLPYFFDHQEVEEVRIASYLLIAGISPSRPTLELIAQSLYREPNPHVGTFVYTHLEQLSNSTHPCLMSWAKNATFALRFAKKFSPSWHYSRFFHLSSFNDDTKLGGALEFGYVSSPQEFIPRSGAIHGNMHILGYSTNIMEVGFNTEGLQKMISKLLGPYSKLARSQSVFELLKSQSSSQSKKSGKQSVPSPEKQSYQSKQQSQESRQPSDQIPESVRDIHRKLKVEQRRPPNLKGHIYFKLFNNEIRYFDLEESMLQNVIQKGLASDKSDPQNGFDVDFYKSAVHIDGQYSWFTEIGFPIHFKVKSSATSKVNGKWSLGQTLKGSAQQSEARFDIDPSMAFQMRGVVEADFYYFKSGATITSQFQSASPLSFSVSLNPNTGDFFTKMDMKNMKENFFHSEISPTFFVESHYIGTSKVPYADLKYVDKMNDAEVMPFDYHYGKYELGFTYEMKGQRVTRNFFPRLPFYPFCGRNQMFMSFKPGVNPPEFAEFQFKYLTKLSDPSIDRRTDTSSEESQAGQTSQEQDKNNPPNGIWSNLKSYIFGANTESEESISSQPRQNTQQQSLQINSRSQQQRSQQSISDSKQQSQQSSSDPQQQSQESSSDPQQQSQESSSDPQQQSQESSSDPQQKSQQRSGIELSRQERRHQSSSSSPAWYGFGVRWVGVGSKPERWAQFEGYYQRNPTKRQHSFNFHYLRTAFPEIEQHSYNVEVKGTFEYPDMEIEPSDLLSPSYQRENQRLIQRFLQRHGEEAMDQMLKLESVRGKDNLFDLLSNPKHCQRDLVEEVVQENKRSSDPKMQQLIKLEENQKQVSQQLQSFVKQRHNVLDSSSKLQKSNNLIEKLSSINDEASKQLEKIPDNSKKDILLKSIVLRQQENQKRLMMIKKSLQSHLDKQQRQALNLKVQGSGQEVQKLLQKQSQKEQSGSKNPKPLVMKEFQAVKQEQAKIMGKVSGSPKKVPKQALRQVLQMTDHLLHQIVTQHNVKENQEQALVLLSVLIQHQQIAEAIKQATQNPLDQSSDKSMESSENDSVESIVGKPQLKELIDRLQDQSRAISLVDQMRKLEKDIYQMQKSNSQNDIQIVTELSKLRLRQIHIGLSLPKLARLDEKEARNVVNKLEEISNEVAQKADQVKHYSPAVDQVKTISQSQIQLLDKVQNIIQNNQEKSLRDRIQGDKLINMDVLNRLTKRIEKSAQRSVPQAVFTVSKLMGEIQLEQQSVEELVKQLGPSKGGQHIADISNEIIQKAKQIVDTISKQPKQPWQPHYLEHVSEMVQKQDKILQAIERDTQRISSSEKQQLKRILQRQHQELREIKVSIDRQVRIGLSSRKQQSSSTSEEMQPITQSDSSKWSSPRSNEQQRVDVPSEVEHLIKEIQQKLKQIKQQISQISNKKKSQLIKESIRLTKEAVAVVSAHSQIRIPENQLRQINEIQKTLQLKIGQGVDSSDEKSLQRRQSSELKVLKDELKQQMRHQHALKESVQSSEEAYESNEQYRELQEMPKQSADNQMFLNMDITFGYKGLLHKHITLQGVAAKSMAQLQWEARQTSPQKDDLVRRYLEEKDNPTAKSEQAYRDLKRELNMFRHYHFNVKYVMTDFEPFYRMMYWRFQEYMKFALYKYGEFYMPKETADQIEFMFDLHRNNKQMDISLFTPYETDKFHGVYLPWMVFMEMFYRADSIKLPKSVPQKVPLFGASQKLPGECELRQGSVRTMDEHVMELPATRSCDVILAMDCSPAAKYVVKARSENRQKRVVTVIAGESRVEVVKDVSISVKVNGQQQPLSQDKSVIVQAQNGKPRKQDVVKVTQEGEDVKISLPQEGIRVMVLQDQIKVQASPFQYSRLCGICGNYDGIQQNDRENPQRLQQRSPSCLLADNILPDDKCNVQPIKDQCSKEQPQSPDACKPVQRQLVKTRQQNGKSQVCFSAEPVKECKPACKEIRPRGKRVSMKCLDQENRNAQILLTHSHHRPLPEIESISVPQQNRFVTDVKEPYSCSRN